MDPCLMSAEVCRSQSPPPLGVRLHQRHGQAREEPRLLAVCAGSLFFGN
jgi:hypothetical protein